MLYQFPVTAITNYAWLLQTMEIYSLIERPEVQNQFHLPQIKVSAGLVPLETPGGSLLLASSSFWCLLGVLGPASVSVSVVTLPSPLCSPNLPLPLLSKNTYI